MAMQSGTHEPDCLRRRSYNTGLHLVSSASDPRRLAGVVHRDVLRVLGKPRYVHTCDNVTKMGAGPEMTVSRRRTYSYGSALIGFPTWNPFESDQFMEGDFSSTELGARRKPAAGARIFTYDMAISRQLPKGVRRFQAQAEKQIPPPPLRSNYILLIASQQVPSCCDHLRRPALYECSEAVERLGEIVSGGGKAKAEMRGRIEAIAGSQQDSTLGGGLAERAVVLSAYQPGERGHAALRRNPAEYVAMVRHEALEELEVSGGGFLGLA